MMKKRIASLVLALVMCLSLCVPSFASELSKDTQLQDINVEAEISRAYRGITDLPITAEMKNGISAQITAENDTVIPLEVFCTIRELASTAGGTSYALTAVTSTSKSSSDVADTTGNINVRLSATIYWTDNAGVDNTLDRATGSWNCYDGCFVGNREVMCIAQPWNLLTPKTKNYYPSSNSFDYSPPGIVGAYLTLSIGSDAFTPDGKTSQRLGLNIEPTIFD